MSNAELVYVIGIVAGVIALARNVFVTLALNTNVELLVAQLVKLIKAGNIDRAQKLCQAVPNAYITAGLIPALEIFQKGGAKRADLVQAYEQGVAKKKPLIMLGRVVGVVAGLLAVGSLALAIMNAEQMPSEAYAAPIIAGVLVSGGEMITKRVVDRANAGFGTLLEALKDARD